MATIADWYAREALVKESSISGMGTLLKRSGVTKEAGVVGETAGKAVDLLGKALGYSGWKVWEKAGLGGRAGNIGERLLRAGKGLSEKGTNITRRSKGMDKIRAENQRELLKAFEDLKPAGRRGALIDPKQVPREIKGGYKYTAFKPLKSRSGAAVGVTRRVGKKRSKVKTKTEYGMPRKVGYGSKKGSKPEVTTGKPTVVGETVKPTKTTTETVSKPIDINKPVPVSTPSQKRDIKINLMLPENFGSLGDNRTSWGKYVLPGAGLLGGGALLGYGAGNMGGSDDLFSGTSKYSSVLLKRAGIQKEASWLGKLVGKAIKGLGTATGTVGWKAGEKAALGGWAGKLGERILQRGKSMREYGKAVKRGSKGTTFMEDLGRFRRTKAFLPTALGAGGLAVGAGTGYLAGR